MRRSLNLPAVGLLARYGPLRFAAMLAAAGQPLRLPAGSAASLPIVLGGAGQTMRGLMALYAALATDGTVAPTAWLPGDRRQAARLLSPAAAQEVASTLTRPLPDTAGEPGIAWKTGTSWGDRDNWAFGFDRDHLVGVWVGRPDGTAMAGGMAADHALPVLARVFGILSPAPRFASAAAHPVSLEVTSDPDPLQLLFPPPDAVISGGGALSLQAMSGVRPLSFLVDGARVPSLGALRDAQWTPPGPGFDRVVVLDAGGHTAGAAIRVIAR